MTFTASVLADKFAKIYINATNIVFYLTSQSINTEQSHSLHLQKRLKTQGRLPQK